MDVMKKVPVREQDPKVRATNFEEVCYGYNEEEAVAEAERCLNCKNARCVEGCPVNIDIPTFIREVKERKFEDAANTIALSSALPASDAAYVRRRASVKESVSAALRANPSPSVSWSVSLPTGPERTASFPRLLRQSLERRLL